MSTLIVIAKAPVPGLVKTRLTPAFTPGEAAKLAEAALLDTLKAVRATKAHNRLLILDGEPNTRWLPSGFTVIRQIQGGLDRRLAAAFEEAAYADPGPALLVGMDTPQITLQLLTACWPTTEDAVIGPATDGGFWSLGFRTPRNVRLDEILFDVPMSTSETGAIQLDRLRAAGLKTRLLPELRDVDTAEDAEDVANQYPDGHFARQLRSLASSARPATTAAAGGAL